MSTLPDNATRTEVFAHVATILRAEEAEWVAKVAEQAANPVRALLGQGYIARTGNLAIRVRSVPGGQEFVPTHVKPHLCGISHLTRADAERVAARHPGGYKVEHVYDTAKNRLAEIRETLAHIAAYGGE